jgi:hypothetical protein
VSLARVYVPLDGDLSALLRDAAQGRSGPDSLRDLARTDVGSMLGALASAARPGHVNGGGHRQDAGTGNHLVSETSLPALAGALRQVLAWAREDARPGADAVARVLRKNFGIEEETPDE